jgi:hypothetical protein
LPDAGFLALQLVDVFHRLGHFELGIAVQADFLEAPVGHANGETDASPRFQKKYPTFYFARIPPNRTGQ